MSIAVCISCLDLWMCITYAILFLLIARDISFSFGRNAITHRHLLPFGKAAMHKSVPTCGCWQRRNTSDGRIDICSGHSFTVWETHQYTCKRPLKTACKKDMVKTEEGIFCPTRLSRFLDDHESGCTPHMHALNIEISNRDSSSPSARA